MDTPGSTNPFGAAPQPTMIDLRVGFGPRFLAWVIDLLLAGLFSGALAYTFMQLDVRMADFMQKTLSGIEQFYALFGLSSEITDDLIKVFPALTLGGMISGIMYPLIEGLTGASPGKRVLKIVVAQADGQRGFTALWVKRFLIKNLGNILQFFLLVPSLQFIDTIGDFFSVVIFVGCFFVLGQDRLALHDRLAQTAVYYREDLPS